MNAGDTTAWGCPKPVKSNPCGMRPSTNQSEFAFCVGLRERATWSPRLNSKGNSVMVMKVLEVLAIETQETIFWHGVLP